MGFKWFVAGLRSGELGFGGEESAGASFLRLDGGAWSTDKDGIVPVPAGGGDHRAQRPRSRRGLPGSRARSGGAVRRSPRRARDPGAEKEALQARPLASPHHGARRRAHRAGADARAGKRCADRRRQGRARRTAGSRRGRRAPRTSTRSTPRASATQGICAKILQRGAGHRRRRRSPGRLRCGRADCMRQAKRRVDRRRQAASALAGGRRASSWSRSTPRS